MKLYHGSSVIVKKPILLKNQRPLDFGAGFYTTSNYEQAKRWAKITALRQSFLCSYVSCYEIDDVYFHSLRILRFSSANEDWLDFITNNRKGIYQVDNFDLIIGPVADDKTISVITYYLNGIYNKQEAIVRLLPQNLTDQFVFKTQIAIDKLRFIESVKYEKN